MQRSPPEIFKLMVDKGYYNVPTVWSKSSFMCSALYEAKQDHMISNTEFTDCRMVIREFLTDYDFKGCKFVHDTLHNLVTRVNPYDSFYTNRGHWSDQMWNRCLEIYLNWDNRDAILRRRDFGCEQPPSFFVS